MKDAWEIGALLWFYWALQPLWDTNGRCLKVLPAHGQCFSAKCSTKLFPPVQVLAKGIQYNPQLEFHFSSFRMAKIPSLVLNAWLWTWSHSPPSTIGLCKHPIDFPAIYPSSTYFRPHYVTVFYEHQAPLSYTPNCSASRSVQKRCQPTVCWRNIPEPAVTALENCTLHRESIIKTMLFSADLNIWLQQRSEWSLSSTT